MDFFPPDVKFRIHGDKKAGEALIGESRNMFFKATLMQQERPGVPVQLVRYLENGGAISVLLLESHKIVTINVPYIPVPEETDEAALDVAAGIYVLCGIIRYTGDVTVSGTDYLDDFRPTASTARAHKVPNSYTNNAKLAHTGPPVAAGNYSGTMKRVVAAVEGLGKIKDASGAYLTSTPVTRIVVNQYQTYYYQTHGIYKAGPKNHWLIEISGNRGVLAMPLPLINSTRGEGYLKRLVRLGDTGGAAIVREFGGLPSGETFPTGTALTNAITAGRVLQLLTAADLNGFYAGVVGETHRLPFSWAFSESGSRAVTTRFVFQKTPEDPLKYMLRGQMWEIRINLSLHDRTKPRPLPVGTGTASLILTSDGGRLSKSCCRRLWGGGNQEEIEPILRNYINVTSMVDLPDRDIHIENLQDEHEDWGAVVYAFFDGEYLKRVLWVPSFLWEYWGSASLVEFEPVYYAGGGTWDENLAPFYGIASNSGWKNSPPGFIMDNIDLREMDVWQRSSGPTYIFDVKCTGHDNVGVKHAVTTYTDGHVLDLSYDPPPGVSVAFVATPTNFVISSPAIVSADLECYYAESSLPALYSALYSGPSYNYGIGGLDGRPDSLSTISCIIPGQCREGAVFYRYQTKEGANRHAVGYFSGKGTRIIDVNSNMGDAWDYRYNAFYAANINPGPTDAYIITKELALQRQLVYHGGSPVSPGYVTYNLLDGTSVGFTPTTDNLTFIGSY